MSAAVLRFGSVAQYYRSIELLRDLGVSDKRLATLFQTGAANIRQVAARIHSEVNEAAPPSISDLLGEYGNEQQWEKLRKKSAASGRLKSRRRREAFEQELSQVFTEYAKAENFASGARALRSYLPYVARASEAETLRLRSVVYQSLAWMLTQSGFSNASIRQATIAMRSAKNAFEESLGDREYLKQYHESALICSNALLLSHLPDAAMQILNQADAAVMLREGRLGSEHYRQRATALFQKGEDEAANKLFAEAGQAAKEAGYSDFIQVRMASERQLNVIQPVKGLTRAYDLSDGAARFFGEDSQEYAMATLSAIASAYYAGSPIETRQACERLNAVEPSRRSFGHYATVKFLLSITPELNLPISNLRRWVRFLLYENAVRLK